MKIRLLILSFYYPPDLCAGSFRASAFVQSLLKQYSNQIEIEVITTLPNRYSTFKNDAQEFEQSENLTIHRITLPNHKSGFIDQALAFLYFMRTSLKLIKSKRYDIIYGTSSRLMTAALSAYVSKQNSTPLYLDIRDIFVDTMDNILPKYLSSFFIPIFNIIERFTIKQASHVNLVSKGFESYFTNKYPNQHFSFFTNGIDDEFLDFNFTHTTDSTNKQIKILYAGNIGEGQGLHIIIPELAMKLGDEYQFVLFGDGGKRNQLELSLNEHNIHNVQINNPINREELKQQYASADILFLHLNDYEAFEKVLPSKLFEYAATGKPILAGVSGYSKEFIDSQIDNAEVFSPGNVNEAMNAIQRLNIESIQRSDFINNYSREKIMDAMSHSLMKLSELANKTSPKP